MSNSLFMAFTGLNSRARALDVAANNSSNLQSPGFKKQLIAFTNISNLPEGTTELERATKGPLVTITTAIDMSPGEVLKTDNPLHVALSGNGFFTLDTPNGLGYSRNGSFRINPRNELVSGDGYPLLKVGTRPGEKARLVLPQGAVEISSAGEVSVDGAQVGKLRISAFKDTRHLASIGGSLFVAGSGALESTPSEIRVMQGFLEQSNVNPIAGLADMISIMRSFEMLNRVTRSLTDVVDRRVLDDIGRL